MMSRTVGPFAGAATLLLVVLIASGGALQRELRFFLPGTITAGHDFVPVPQYNPGEPATDASLRLAARNLSAGTGCVIDADAWSDVYQRAAFLLIPRDIWPYSMQPARVPATRFQIAEALTAHDASCLLSSSDSDVPSGLRRLTSGPYSLYVSNEPGRR